MNFVREISALGVVEVDDVVFSTDGDSFLSRINFVVTVNIDCLLGYLITKGLVVYSFSLTKNSVGALLKIVNCVRNIPHNNQDV